MYAFDSFFDSNWFCIHCQFTLRATKKNNLCLKKKCIRNNCAKFRKCISSTIFKLAFVSYTTKITCWKWQTNQWNMDGIICEQKTKFFHRTYVSTYLFAVLLNISWVSKYLLFLLHFTFSMGKKIANRKACYFYFGNDNFLAQQVLIEYLLFIQSESTQRLIKKKCLSMDGSIETCLIKYSGKRWNKNRLTAQNRYNVTHTKYIYTQREQTGKMDWQ